MRKFRFIGTEDDRQPYAVVGGVPDFDKVYKETDTLGGRSFTKIISWVEDYPREWEEVFENQSAPSKEERIEFMRQFMRQFDISYDDLVKHV
jgi:hypothetical protein